MRSDRVLEFAAPLMMVGTSVEHYKILRVLGQGGMGEVYEAEDTKLGRRVALKLLPQHFAAVGNRRERFEREVRTVAALNHPAIVTIHLTWAPDGRAIDASDPRDGNVWRYPIDATTPRRLTNFTGFRFRALAWSPDGQRLAISRGVDRADVVLFTNIQKP